MSRHPKKLYIYNLRWRDGIEGHYYQWVVSGHKLGIFQDRHYEWEAECISSHHTLGEAMDFARARMAEASK